MKITINDDWVFDNLFEIGQKVWFHDLRDCANEDRGIPSGCIVGYYFDKTSLWYEVRTDVASTPKSIPLSRTFSCKEDAIEKIYNVKIQREEDDNSN